MKQTIITALLALVALSGRAQTQDNWLWPIKGQESGTNILLRPQDLLGHEVNYGTLVIGAKEGTEVIAPADGFTFQHRGYHVQVVIPEESRPHIDESLASLCPTAALFLRE